MKQYLLFLIFILAFISCNQEKKNSKEPPIPKEVDSLLFSAHDNTRSLELRKADILKIEDYLFQRENDSTKRRNYLKVANRYYSINDFEGEYKSVKIAYELASKAKDTFIIARSYLYIGENFLRLKNLDSAFYYNYKATTLYSITGDKDTQRRALSNLSLIYRDTKDFVKSETYAVEALKVVENDDNFLSKYGVYNTLGNLFADVGKYNQALQYHKKALAATEYLNEKQKTYQLRIRSQSIINIGVLKMEQEQYEEAETYFNKASKVGKNSSQNPLNYAYLLENWAYNKHRLGQKGVMPLFNKALQIHDSLNSSYISDCELLISKYYNEINKGDSAFHYAQSAYYTSRNLGLLDRKLKALHLLAQTDSLNKRPQWYEAYITLQDSIANIEHNQQEKFALIELNTENLTKEKQLAETQRDQATSRFWTALMLSAFVVVIAIMVYVNRVRQLKNKELLLAQKELEANESVYNLMLEEQFKIEQGKHLEKKRISQELHDGVLGKLSGIRLNLFVLNKKKDVETVEKCLPYIKSLQEVEKEIRAISHNLSEDLFSDQVNFTKMVSGMFENISGHSNLKLHLHFDELIDWKTIPTATKIEVYRILQEGFHNIQKHSQASHVVVRMIQTENKIIIELIDDGVGIPQGVTSNGIGLKNMKERAVKINAEFNIDSQINKGTTLSLSIPK